MLFLIIHRNEHNAEKIKRWGNKFCKTKEKNHKFIDLGLDGILKSTFQKHLMLSHHPKTMPSKNRVSV